MKNLSVETLCVQGGYEPKNGETRIPPLYQSTTYKYDNADEVAALFDLEKEGHMYSRISNPSLEVLEKKNSCIGRWSRCINYFLRAISQFISHTYYM